MSRSILAIDLSSSRGSIAVHRAGGTVFAEVFQSERSHNARLFAPLSQALEVLDAAEPAVIVIGTGPGSYTGVRISIAAAQGISLARGWRVLGLPSICTGGHPAYHVLGDARRGMFYHARVAAGRLVQPPMLLTRAEAEATHQADPLQPWLSFDPRPPLPLPGLELCEPAAAALASLAESLDEAAIAELAAAPLEPFYLQEAFITTARKAGKHVPAPAA